MKQQVWLNDDLPLWQLTASCKPCFRFGFCTATKQLKVVATRARAARRAANSRNAAVACGSLNHDQRIISSDQQLDDVGDTHSFCDGAG